MKRITISPPVAAVLLAIILFVLSWPVAQWIRQQPFCGACPGDKHHPAFRISRDHRRWTNSGDHQRRRRDRSFGRRSGHVKCDRNLCDCQRPGYECDPGANCSPGSWGCDWLSERHRDSLFKDFPVGDDFRYGRGGYRADPGGSARECQWSSCAAHDAYHRQAIVPGHSRCDYHLDHFCRSHVAFTGAYHFWQKAFCYRYEPDYFAALRG